MTAAEPSSAATATTAKLSDLSLSQLLEVKFDTVYGAAKHEQRTSEAPAAVSLVTREDIKQLGYRTLADVLRGVRGLYTSFDRGYNFLGVRGVNRPGDYGGRVLLNINGHRMNDPIYDSLFLGQEFPLDVDLIERVEVIRGPGSALYGNNAFFGVINVVTRQGREVGGSGAETAVAHGSFAANSGRFTYGRRFRNGVEVLLSGTVYSSEGAPELSFPEYRATEGGVMRQHDGERARQCFASLAYGDFTLEGLYGRRDKEIPTAAYFSVFGDKREKLWDDRAYSEIRYQHGFAPDWTVLARAYCDHYAYEGVYPMNYDDPGHPGVTISRDRPRARFWGGEVQADRTWRERHHVTFGAEARDDFEQRQWSYDVDPAFTYIKASTADTSSGVYAQDEFGIRPDLTLNAGVRYDHFSTFGGTVNPRAAFIYRLREPTTFKFLYGEAYRAPNAYESDYHDGVYYAANPELQPETIRSFELVWEETLGPGFRCTGTLFHNRVKNLIVQEVGTGGLLRFENANSIDVQGGEAELEGRADGGWRGRVSYAFADATDRASGRVLNNSPQHIAKLQLIAPLYRQKLFGGLEVQATSARQTVQGNTAPGFAVANFTCFSRGLLQNLELSAGLYNVFDRHYRDPAGPDFVQDTIPQDGRVFRIKLISRF